MSLTHLSKRVMFVAALLLVLSPLVTAQTRPDFSGHWELDVERTRAENRARSGGGGGTLGGGGSMMVSGGPASNGSSVTAVKITQTAGAVTIERISGQVWEKVVHPVGAAEVSSSNGRTTLSLKSRWEGSKLVSEGTSRTELSDGEGTIRGTLREVRWIDSDGVMVVESTRVINPPPGLQVGNAGVPTVTKQYFTRR